jgi:hypothetical protein
MESNRAARIVVGIIAAAVFCAGTASAYAAPASVASGDVAQTRPLPDHTARSAGHDTVVVSVAEARLGTLDRLIVPRTSCPAEAPLLARALYEPNEEWSVPPGVEVRGGTGLFADIVGFTGDVSTPAWIGDGISRVVNWAQGDRTVEIRMHCVRPWDATVTRDYRVAAHRVRTSLALGCPDDAPYLVHAASTLPDYQGWQYVFVSGVRVEDQGFIIGDDPNRGAILRAVARNDDGYQTGIADMSIIARDQEKQISVTLFCTDRVAYAARW